MGVKTFSFINIVFTISLVTEIHSSQVQPTLTEYLIAALGSNVPSTPSYQSYGPNYQAYQTPLPYTNQPKQSSIPTGPLKPGATPKPLTAIANLATSIPVAETSLKTPAVPKSSELSSTPLDSNVLNNLAIALQLLIVSNILNTPPENLAKSDVPKLESVTRFETVPISPLTSMPLQKTLPVQNSASIELSALRSLLSSMPSKSSVPVDPISLRNVPSSSLYESLTLPNSKFLGSSSFADPSAYGSPLSSYGSAVTPMASLGSLASYKPNTRSSMSLMSPYEALASGSPYSDPILSSVYSSGVSKRDFQSPYASILAADSNRDLFSVSDFL